MLEIPNVRLSKDELAENCQIMVRGNKLLHDLAQTAGLAHKQFRSKLFKKDFDSKDWPQFNEEQIKSFQDALPAIKAVRDIEWRMLCGFARLVRKHANGWARRVPNGPLVYQDYVQEAFMALLDAIYTYTDADIRFITYSWWVIRNRLSTACNKGQPLTPLTNQAIRLLQKFEETKLAFNRYSTNDEIYEKMKLNPEEIELIQDAQVRVLGPDDGIAANRWYFERYNGSDYTEARRDIASPQEFNGGNFEIRDAFNKADLSDFERKVVETSLYPHTGWREDLAKHEINPRTGKRYTRAGINIILDGALKKIKNAYQQVA